MTTIDEQVLKQEINHIFESGANETRIFEMVKSFTERRGVMPSFEPQTPEEHPDNKYAFPVYYERGCQSGLSKREYFAAMAMQGLLSNPNVKEGGEAEYVSMCATEQADELIKALNKEVAD